MHSAAAKMHDTRRELILKDEIEDNDRRFFATWRELNASEYIYMIAVSSFNRPLLKVGKYLLCGSNKRKRSYFFSFQKKTKNIRKFKLKAKIFKYLFVLKWISFLIKYKKSVFTFYIASKYL